MSESLGNLASHLQLWHVGTQGLDNWKQSWNSKNKAILRKSGPKDTAFTTREWSQFKSWCKFLSLFAEATTLTQGEKVVTVSAVAPCVLSLNHHLENLKGSMCCLGNLIETLQTSPQRKFKGNFVNVKMAENSWYEGQPLPFSDPICLKAA